MSSNDERDMEGLNTYHPQDRNLLPQGLVITIDPFLTTAGTMAASS
jgi:hypothetical protein